MSRFEKVKFYYDSGLWDMNRVKNAVLKGWITQEEYESIVGDAQLRDESGGAVIC